MLDATGFVHRLLLRLETTTTSAKRAKGELLVGTVELFESAERPFEFPDSKFDPSSLIGPRIDFVLR